MGKFAPMARKGGTVSSYLQYLEHYIQKDVTAPKTRIYEENEEILQGRGNAIHCESSGVKDTHQPLVPLGARQPLCKL